MPGTLAAQYFVPGDIVLGIQGYSARDLLHMEAIDLVRQPVKSLELLVQKAEHTPASIWGPEPVLKRPTEWLRQSPSPVTYPKSKVGYRPASVLRNHFEGVSHIGFQQQPAVRKAYTPTALDSRLKQQFESISNNGIETSGKMPETRYQTSSAIQHVASDFDQAVNTGIRHYCDNTQYVQGHNHVPKGNHNLHTPREIHEMTSDTRQQTNYVYGYQLQESFRRTPEQEFQYTNKSVRSTHPPQMALKQEHINTFRNDPDNSNKNVAESTKEQRSAEVGRPCSRDAGECKVRPVAEKPRISATADILKRPISPEFTTFPNSKSNSLLKLVLSKSLLNYSPQDFEKMRATVTETYDESDDAEDSDTDEDEDEDAEEAGKDDGDLGSTSCGSSLATSGSAIFERYWMAENDEGEYSDDSELRQYGTSPDSLGRNSSETSTSSPFPDSATSTSDNHTG
jgi:hypothetical protein